MVTEIYSSLLYNLRQGRWTGQKWLKIRAEGLCVLVKGKQVNTADLVNSVFPATRKGLMAVFAVISSAFMATGCVTVVEGGLDALKSAETSIEEASLREPIKEAAARVQNTPWPQENGQTMTRQMASIMLGAAETQSDSIDQQIIFYREILLTGSPYQSAAQQPSSQVHTRQTYSAALAKLQTDADAQILAVADLQRALNDTFAKTSPQQKDVALVEETIGALSRIRKIYVGTYKSLAQDNLAQDNSDISASDISALKLSFVKAGQELSLAADRLQQQRMRENLSTQNAPVSTITKPSVNNFSGSS